MEWLKSSQMRREKIESRVYHVMLIVSYTSVLKIRSEELRHALVDFLKERREVRTKVKQASYLETPLIAESSYPPLRARFSKCLALTFQTTTAMWPCMHKGYHYPKPRALARLLLDASSMAEW